MSGKIDAKPRIGNCRHCGETGHIEARGLDRRCYDQLVIRGEIDDYERTNRRQVDFVEDYKTLQLRGLCDADIAEALRYKVKSISKLKTRARRAGYAI
jgi:hypothetical protein